MIKYLLLFCILAASQISVASDSFVAKDMEGKSDFEKIMLYTEVFE